MKQNPERIWVYPEFKRLLKIKAATENLDIVQYTKQLSSNDNFEKEVEEMKQRYRRRPLGFDFP